jgi:hypothetical protein
MVRKKLQNYTSGAVGDGCRDLPPCPTAIGRRAVGRDLVSFQKFVIFLFKLGWR